MEWIRAVERLRRDREPGVLVTVADVRGHAPRDAGAKMVVGATRTWDTVGGGNLEAVAIERARELIAAGATNPELVTSALSDKAPYEHGVQCCGGEVSVLLELRNSKEHRLGLPLPRGKVRVYKADAAGSQQFIGEDWIDHTPQNERVRIKLGEAFDVVGERTQKEYRKLAPGLWEVEWEIALRNHKTQDQLVTVIEPVPGDWQVLQSTHAWEKPQAHTLRFSIAVPKESAAKLVYRVRIRG